MDHSVITFDRVCFSYADTEIFKEISLYVPEGDFLVVIGPNGGGKSTLVKLILGLLKPSSGRISVLEMEPSRAVSRIGYVPQNVNRSCDFPISIFDVVLMGRIRRHSGFAVGYSGEDRRRARKALEKMALWDLRKKRFGELSMGQRQRVLIARALATEPAILLLDEPAASVDIEARKVIYDCLKDINEKTTIVMVSHDLTVIPSYARSVACVNRDIYYHDSSEITSEMFESTYGSCPVELIGHGLPHRVLSRHRLNGDEKGDEVR